MTAFGLALMRVTPPAAAPVGLQEMKDHLNVDFNSDDSKIRGMIAAAVRAAEEESDLAFMSQKWVWELEDWWPTFLQLPKAPLQESTAVPGTPESLVVEYQDSTDATQTLDAADYRVSLSRRLIETRQGVTLPELTQDYVTGRIKLTWLAGVSDAGLVHEAVSHAIKLYVGDLYMNRETVKDSTLETFRNLLRTAREDWL